ncbi:MAG: FKBP-type peptidyl-prolyl cis-trans isomerase [Nannocystaceae bacterium]
MPGGITVHVVAEGHGPRASEGDAARLHYMLTLGSPQVIESSHHGDPRVILIGHDPGYIEGLHLGLVGMRSGELRKIVIPPALGYRNRAMAKIPPRTDLHFLVELTQLSPGGDRRP